MTTNSGGKRARWLLPAGVVVIAGGMVLWWVQRRVEPRPPAALPVVSMAMPARPSPSIGVSAALPANASPPSIPPHELASLEQKFRSDSQDGAWSVPAEQRLTEAASEPALAALGMPDDFSATCAAHLCRIAMHFPSRQSADDWAQFYPVGLGETLDALRVEETFEADGGVRLLVFGARQGFAPMLAAGASGRPAPPSGP